MATCKNQAFALVIVNQCNSCQQAIGGVGKLVYQSAIWPGDRAGHAAEHDDALRRIYSISR